jgi:hypothetical protein
MVSVQYAIPTEFAVHILRLDEMPNPLIGCLSEIICFSSAAPGTRVT